jgi:hypothetical protein
MYTGSLLWGSPETNQERLVQIPAGYIEAYKQFTHKDSHVVSLAYKLLPDMPVGKAWVLECEMVEVNSSLQDLWYVYNIGCCRD